MELATVEPGLANCTEAWFLCQTRSCHGADESLAEYLGRHEAPHYLPMRVVRVKNGIVDGEQIYREKLRPLFPNYLFLSGQHSADVAYENDNCASIKAVAAGMQKQLTAELTSIEKALIVHPALTSGPLFRKGRLAKIVWPHKLAGTIGRVSRDNYDGNVYINVPLLNSGMPIPVEPECVELISERSKASRRFKICCGVCGSDTQNVDGICERCT